MCWSCACACVCTLCVCICVLCICTCVWVSVVRLKRVKVPLHTLLNCLHYVSIAKECPIKNMRLMQQMYRIPYFWTHHRSGQHPELIYLQSMLKGAEVCMQSETGTQIRWETSAAAATRCWLLSAIWRPRGKSWALIGVSCAGFVQHSSRNMTNSLPLQ